MNAVHGPARKIAALAALMLAGVAQAATIGADFAGSYTATNLGTLASLPTKFGGLTFLDGNTLLIGGAANTAAGLLYTVDVTRGADGHITGFTGPVTPFASIGTYNDGGVVFGPGGVLFTSQWPVNKLGQTKPGSTVEDKTIDLTALGVGAPGETLSHAAINFVPATFGGAGEVKLVSWSSGAWYSASLAPDGNGTYDLVGLKQVDLDPTTPGVQNLPGGPEGFTYIAAGNAGFSSNSMLVSAYSAGTVEAYTVDANGDPILSSGRDFLSGLSGAEGAAIDPLTGDFLFSTFGSGNQIELVSGFTVPVTAPVPEPSSVALMLGGLTLLGGRTLSVFNTATAPRRRRCRGCAKPSRCSGSDPRSAPRCRCADR
jgi:hypothetical protein